MNKTILITGTSSGIGKETAKLFQSKGWNVIATMRSPEKETDLNQLSNTLVTRLDVTDLDSINEAVRLGIQRFGKIDVLVNNAGYGAYGTLESFPRDGIVRQFNTNVIGLLDVTRAVLPHFRQNKKGLVINISSIMGQMTFPLGALYNGTKFAVEGISEALRYELDQLGVKIKLVEPGIIATDFSGRSLDIGYDESLTEYESIVSKVMGAMPKMLKNASPASLVANVIFVAATDGKNKLRYLAGPDAKVSVFLNKWLGYNFMVRSIKFFFKL